MDACRTAVRLGSQGSLQHLQKNQDEMANMVEIEEAEEEGYFGEPDQPIEAVKDENGQSMKPFSRYGTGRA